MGGLAPEGKFYRASSPGKHHPWAAGSGTWPSRAAQEPWTGKHKAFFSYLLRVEILPSQGAALTWTAGKGLLGVPRLPCSQDSWCIGHGCSPRPLEVPSSHSIPAAQALDKSVSSVGGPVPWVANPHGPMSPAAPEGAAALPREAFSDGPPRTLAKAIWQGFTEAGLEPGRVLLPALFPAGMSCLRGHILR